MILLALDLSLNCSGWALFDTSKRAKKDKLVQYGHILNKHLPSSLTGNKLIHLEMQLATIKFAYNPEIIIKEELSGKGKIDTMQLAKTHGSAERIFNTHKLIDINNMTFKKNFTGKGNASKDEVAAKVLEYLPGLHFRTDDESDAIGIGINHLIDIGEWK